MRRQRAEFGSTITVGPTNSLCMATKATVSPADLEFLQWVSSAAFANPFSDQRYELDRKIAGKFRNEDERGRFLQRAVSQRVQRLETQGKADLGLYSGEDGEVMRNVFLFDAYHQSYQRLDQLIDAQAKAGDTPARVTFAGEILALLARRGFSTAEGVRFFGIFFQLRRAFYFILQGLIGQTECMKSFRRHLWDNVFTHDIRCYDR